MNKSAACMTLFLCLLLAARLPAADLPDPKTGGKDGRPLAILFLSWAPRLDATYAEKLTARGFVCGSANYLEPIALEFLRQFNVFVLDELPNANYDYRAGMEHYRATMGMLRRCVEDGAGLLTYAGYGAHFQAGWNRELAPYGITSLHRGVLDPSVGGLAPWRAYVQNSYGWTTNLHATHPVTAGLQRVYYPMGELNGTAVFPTVPLICDAAWTPLVRTMPGSHLVLFTPPDGGLLYEPGPPAPRTIVAARAVGNGRMAACGIVPEFTHRGGYSSGNTRYELRLGNQGGTMLEKGDGMIPSDAAELLLRLYAWLAGDSATAGFGGYVPGTPAVAGAPAPDPNAGLPWRSYRALIGARSKYGGGTGTVAEYAQAAKDAGFSLLVFTERFAALDPAQWDAYLADCAASSDETLTVLPGFEIDDVEGSHFLYLAPPFYPHRSWLTADGRRLLSPYTLNFYYAKHMVVVHRPESSPIPTERLKHFQGISVYTYRDGALVDNSLAAFQWQVQSASFPVPIVVHELNSPAEVAAAARTGFQQWLPEAPTPADAVNRFCRQGYNHPTHPMISEGPRIAPLEVLDLPDPNRRMEAKEAQTFELAVRVEHTIPLHTITLYDGFTPVRRWRTTEKNFAATAVFPFSHQYGFSVIAEDAAGKRALRSMFWIAPGRWPGHFRCTDRQNWLGHLAMYYTGAFLPFGGAYHALKMPIKGTEEGNGLFTALPGTCMAAKLQTPFTGNDVVLTEFLLDEKYVDATFKTVGLAATPSRASRRSSVYAGRVRHYSFTQSHEAEPWVALIEYDLTLKRAVEPINPAGLFPAIDQVRAAKYCWWDGTRFITGAMNPAARDQVLPIPRGGLGGGVIPLDDGFALSDGRIGRLLPGAPDYLPAGTRLAGRFLVAGRSNQVGAYDTVTRNFDAAPERWLRAMGFAGATPYALRFTRGTAGPVAFCVPVTPEAYGVAGAVRTSADIPYDLPLQITGLNPRWVAGSWREGERIRYTGVFENTAWPRLNVGKPGAFYAGNLLTADHPHLVLAIRAWTADAISIEVHNPTGAAIEATVATPPEMRGYTALRAKVAVPAGATVWLEAP